MTLTNAQVDARFARVAKFAIQQCGGNQQQALALFVRGVCEMLMSVHGDENKLKGIDLTIEYLHKVRDNKFGGFEQIPTDPSISLHLTLTEATIVAVATSHHKENGFVPDVCDSILTKIEKACHLEDASQEQPASQEQEPADG